MELENGLPRSPRFASNFKQTSVINRKVQIRFPGREPRSTHREKLESGACRRPPFSQRPSAARNSTPKPSKSKLLPRSRHLRRSLIPSGSAALQREPWERTTTPSAPSAARFRLALVVPGPGRSRKSHVAMEIAAGSRVAGHQAGDGRGERIGGQKKRRAFARRRFVLYGTMIKGGGSGSRSRTSGTSTIWSSG